MASSTTTLQPPEGSLERRLPFPQRLGQPLSAPALIAWAATLGSLVFVALRLLVLGPSAFTLAGESFSDPLIRGDHPGVQVGTGYDGQFTYRLALDPWSSEDPHHGIRFDSPAYRHQRIATPALAWGLARATPLGTGVSLVLINVVAIWAAVYVAARLLVGHAASLGRRLTWALVVGLPLGSVISLARDLTEPVAWAASLAAVDLYYRGRLRWAAGAFVLAVLARETALLVPAGIGVHALVAAWRVHEVRLSLARLMTALVPLLAFVAWQAWLWATYGSVPVLQGDNAGAPLVGVVRTLSGDVPPPFDAGQWTDRLMWQWERILLLALLVWTAVRLRRSPWPPGVRVAWVLAAALALTLRGWLYDAQFLRAAHEAIGLSALILVTDRTWPSRVLCWALAATTGLLSLRYVTAT